MGDGCTIVNILEIIESHALSGQTIWQINYISKKLFSKRSKIKGYNDKNAHGRITQQQDQIFNVTTEVETKRTF